MNLYNVFIHGDYVEQVSYFDIFKDVQNGTYTGLTQTEWGFFSDKGIVKFKKVV